MSPGRPPSRLRYLALWVALVATASVASLAAQGCALPEPDALAMTPPGNGPRVVFDLDHRPIPEIPFPNDLATRPDPDSITGLRLNASLVGPTSFEGLLRGRIDSLNGWSTFGPITVRFDEPLDVASILDRHGDDLAFGDDVAYLVDLETGEPVPLDIGGGAYPVVVENPYRYYPNDPRAGESNLLFETVEEDLDGDGVLDPGEDTDGDGVLDHPNTLTPGGVVEDELLTFYERETNTFIMRPLVPLHPERTYAVVLTNRLVGTDGEPVRSPWEFINHTQQTAALRPLLEHLAGLGLALNDVAFVWSFTTQSTTRDLEELRMGLYGEGPFAWLADEFPPDTELENAYDDPSSATINPYVIRVEDMLDALGPLAGALLGAPEIVDDLFATYELYVDYAVIGRARTPHMLTGPETIWELDRTTGDANIEAADLPWLITIPKERPEHGITAPFPVAIYVHGTGGFRIEALGFAAHLAKFGIATVGFDGYAHGMALPEELQSVFVGFLEQGGFGPWAAAHLDNRTIDINADGINDPAGDYWSKDTFRMRDAIRSTALDVSRLVQIFRSWDGTKTWSFDADDDGIADLEGLAGDFNDDGTVDIVGPAGPYFVFGNSLGGLGSSIAAAIEPYITVAAPISTGGGLMDILRSLQTGLPEYVLLPNMGPFIYNTTIEETDEEVLALYVNDGWSEESHPFHTLPPIAPGDRIRVTNLRNGEVRNAVVGANGLFRVAIPTDVGDGLRVECLDPLNSELLWRVDSIDRAISHQGIELIAGDPLLSIMAGLGMPRQSPEIRRFVALSQLTLDPGDPVNYAGAYWIEPLYADYPGVGAVTHVALNLTAGDMNVPISTGWTLARAAGLVPFMPGDEDPRYGATAHRVLIDNYVYEGLERLKRFDRAPWDDPREIVADSDWLAEGLDEFDAPTLSEPMRLTLDLDDGGVGVVRMFYVNPRGHHSIQPPDPRATFDIKRYAINAIGHYFDTLGTEWVDDLCLVDDSCAFIPID